MKISLLARFKRLSLWNKLGVLGAIASVVGLALFFWPSNPQRAIEVKNSPKAVVNSPQSIIQNISDSPGSMNVAAGTVIFGDPPLTAQQIREKYRTILNEIHPNLLNAVDEGASEISAYISRTHVARLEKLGRQQASTNYLHLIVRGPGPIIIGSGNSGSGIWDQLQDGVLMKCTLSFKEGIRNQQAVR